MDMTVDLEEAEMTLIPEDIRCELMQDTHACFFSLLRDVICSTPEHRMTLPTLEDRVKAWAASPISPLNDWYSAITADTTGGLHSAVIFLSGYYTDWHGPGEFLPYMEYEFVKASYQWTGTGRDTDSHLVSLCQHWADRRHFITMEEVCQFGESHLPPPSPPPPRSPTPPPPHSPTPHFQPSPEEIELSLFREQERVRFENPHIAFTYKTHGREYMVGPVKGHNRRTHPLLKEKRPKAVSISVLVRDAIARLPNGEGSRGDVCALVRDSQYVVQSVSNRDVHFVVGKALDKLQHEQASCIKYDRKRKIWTCLHRAQTEQELERIHQERQKLVKGIVTAALSCRGPWDAVTEASSEVPDDSVPQQQFSWVDLRVDNEIDSCEESMEGDLAADPLALDTKDMKLAVKDEPAFEGFGSCEEIMEGDPATDTLDLASNPLALDTMCNNQEVKVEPAPERIESCEESMVGDLATGPLALDIMCHAVKLEPALEGIGSCEEIMEEDSASDRLAPETLYMMPAPEVIGNCEEGDPASDPLAPETVYIRPELEGIESIEVTMEADPLTDPLALDTVQFTPAVRGEPKLKFWPNILRRCSSKHGRLHSAGVCLW